MPDREPRPRGDRQARHRGVLDERGDRRHVDEGAHRPGGARLPEHARARRREPPDRPLPRQPARPGLGVRALDHARRRLHERDGPARGRRRALARRALLLAPGRRARSPASTRPGGTELDLSEGDWIINPGGVGQPRDGDPRAAWLCSTSRRGTRAGAASSTRSTTPRARSSRPGCPSRCRTASTTASEAPPHSSRGGRRSRRAPAGGLRRQGPRALEARRRRAHAALEAGAGGVRTTRRRCDRLLATDREAREEGRGAAVERRPGRARLAGERREEPGVLVRLALQPEQDSDDHHDDADHDNSQTTPPPTTPRLRRRARRRRRRHRPTTPPTTLRRRRRPAEPAGRARQRATGMATATATATAAGPAAGSGHREAV